jgi:hypothetical protein
MTGAPDESRIWGMSPDELAALLVPLFESLPRGSDDELIDAEEWLATLGAEFADDGGAGPSAG